MKEKDKVFAIPLTPVETTLTIIFCAFCKQPLDIIKVLSNGIRDEGGEEMWSCQRKDCNRAGWGK